MHRRMVAEVRALDPSIGSWTRLPQPRALASFAPGTKASRLAVVASLCDALAVMRDGAIVETMDVAQLQARQPGSDYTARLLGATDGVIAPPPI